MRGALTFPSGASVRAGDFVVAAQNAIMRSEENYSDALRFNGFRFVPGVGKEEEVSRFSEASPAFPLWGGGKMAW